MKKARIILASVVLLTIMSAALAFNAEKFCVGPRAYSWTDFTSSTVGNFVYTAAGLFCVTPAAQSFINTINASGVAVTTYSTTTPNQVVTLTHLPGGQTITRAFIDCQLIQNTFLCNG